MSNRIEVLQSNLLLAKKLHALAVCERDTERLKCDRKDTELAALRAERDLYLESLHWMYCATSGVGRDSKRFTDGELERAKDHAQQLLSTASSRFLTPAQVAALLPPSPTEDNDE